MSARPLPPEAEDVSLISVVQARPELRLLPPFDRQVRAAPGPARTAAAPFAAAALMMALGVALRIPTRWYTDYYHGELTQGEFNKYIYHYIGAYSDIASLWVRDQLWTHPIPYLDYPLEYPVGIGALVWIASSLTSSLWAYFLVTAVVLCVAGLALFRLAQQFEDAHPWLLALWPTLPLYVALNWDLLALAPTVGALLLFRRHRDSWAALALAADLRIVGAAFAVHTLLIFAVAGLAVALVAARAPVRALDYLPTPPPPGWLDRLLGSGDGQVSSLYRLLVQPLANWDGVWYSLIAQHGYWYAPSPQPDPSAFWPLYPLLVGIGGLASGWSVPLVGVFISNLSLLPALLLLYRLARLDYGAATAGRAVWLLALFPTAFFFSAVYTESIFLLLSVASVYCARIDRWGWATLTGVLAALTRNTGVLLLLPLGLLLVQHYGWGRQAWVRALPLAAIALAPLLYLGYVGVLWGDPLLPVEVQSLPQWGRHQVPPWVTFRDAYNSLDLAGLGRLRAGPSLQTLVSFDTRVAFQDSKLFDFGITMAFVPLVGYTLARLRPAYSLYALAAFLVPLSSPSQFSPLLGMPRYLIVLFPCFVALALLLRQRWALYPMLALFTTQFILLLAQFSTWFFVA